MSKQKNQMNAPDREQGSRINKDTAKRLLSYIGAYKKTLVVVFICIILSALASVASAMFIEILIDDYITVCSDSFLKFLRSLQWIIRSIPG